ncbi:energy-coupling factor transporter transmembrane protein EcfT [Corynebacterium diphtheriae]|nr:energy-coupling factor transporter transmembrane protein EcfT [Corynebacterium diphtheriae]
MNLLQATNPVTRVAALMLLTTPLLLSVDVVSAAVSLVLTIVLSPLAGVGVGTLLRRGFPLLIATPIAGISMALYGRPEGHEYFSFLFAHVTDNSLQLAVAIMVRVLAVGLPAIVLLAHTDPTELGDGLAQILRLPHRFVISAVASTRMISLFTRDWQSMRRARRVRGIDDSNRVRSSFSMVFGLLVLAVRRGSKLATAMEARGFGRKSERTWARESTVGAADAVLLLVCVAASTSAIVAAIVTGSFRFLGA